MWHLRLKTISEPKHTRLKFDLEELGDNDVLETFQAIIGGMFATFIIMSNENRDLNSMVTTCNTALTEAVREILGKHRQKKKKKKTDPKKRFKPEGSGKYRETNNNIRRCMKETTEN